MVDTTFRLRVGKATGNGDGVVDNIAIADEIGEPTVIETTDNIVERKWVSADITSGTIGKEGTSDQRVKAGRFPRAGHYGFANTICLR